MIQPERVQYLNEEYPARGRYVLYWMQQSQRSRCNHALELAVREADRLKVPVLAVFGITQRFPEAQERHYAFMLEGLAQTRAALAERGIKLVIRLESPIEAVASLSTSAALVVTDRGYLRIQRSWRERLARLLPCRLVQVESDVVVPVEVASGKEEYAARTIRPKIHGRLDDFLRPLEETEPRRDSLRMRVSGLRASRPDSMLERLSVARRARRTSHYPGGEQEAQKRLALFLKDGLSAYARAHSDPGLDVQSNLAPYLHFGQISPLDMALSARAAHADSESTDAFLEELIVRRELSMNFCFYNREYDSWECLPDWARKTLKKHARDKREYVYDEKTLERGRTHDLYWNAAQTEMRLTGKMHGYMRMYWGKKIIEWSRSTEEAFRTALRLNNRYSLDGRDPNSFAGVAWCFGKHDRPWKERAVFGQVRWMSAQGLERKFDMESYVRRVAALED